MPTRNLRQLLEATPADRQRRIEKRFQKSLAAMPLDQLRKAQEMTQLQRRKSSASIRERSRRLSTGPTSVSVPWPKTSRPWAAGSRSARCSRIEKCGSRSLRSWRASRRPGNGTACAEYCRALGGKDWDRTVCLV